MKKLIKKVPDKICAMMSVVVNSLYERSVRKKLRNNDFSIICSNCIGGLIYHRLGLPFLSPTINLWISQPDFLKFVMHIREYLEEELVFENSEYPYPVARLKDIHIYFAHYKSDDEARACWERRKTRINYDNLFIIMYERDGITEDDIRQLEHVPCRAKIVLSDKPHSRIDYVFRIKPTNNPDGQQCVDTDWLGIRTYEKKFDYVKWLNEGRDR